MTRPLRSTTITGASSLFADGSLALASFNRTCRDHRPGVSAALTTVAFDQSGPRSLGISDLIAEPEGPTFISYKVARRRLDRLQGVNRARHERCCCLAGPYSPRNEGRAGRST